MIIDDKGKENVKDPQLSLIDLLNLKAWQKIQDGFSSITDIGLRTFDAKGTPLTSPSGWPRLCKEILQKSPLRPHTCEACLPTFLGGRATVDRNLSFTCPFGLHNFITPLSLDQNKTFGYVIVGPVILVSRKSKEEYYKIAEELNIDTELFWNAIVEIRVLSFFRLQTIVDLIKDISAYILKLSYENMAVGEEIRKITSESTSRLTGFLDKFLNVALQVSGADIGSVMMLDKNRETLTIYASKGLSGEVVKNARVRVGEGISGTALKENASFLIDERRTDNRIRQYLNRPQIKSSMVLPIKIDDNALGVMNLGALETSPVRFNMDNVKSINELIELATLIICLLLPEPH